MWSFSKKIHIKNKNRHQINFLKNILKTDYKNDNQTQDSCKFILEWVDFLPSVGSWWALERGKIVNFGINFSYFRSPIEETNPFVSPN